jgi:hypothetical protein
LSNAYPRVAVIGAGPAGIVSAREAVRHGCEVAIYEAGSAVGGVWVYSERTEQDPLGQDSDTAVHSSLYDSLTTNIPRDLMAFADYTFDSAGGGDDLWPRFPHHTQVRQYLDRFVNDFDLRKLIRFNSRVEKVQRLETEWLVSTNEGQSGFDAVMVCNGHYAKPKVPQLPGLEGFTGTVIHSHNYRHADAFAGKRVALWGTSASGFDISIEIAKVAEHVFWCGNAFNEPVQLGPNRTGLPSLERVSEQGELMAGKTDLTVDCLMFCTGYHYDFPFLTTDLIKVDENLVSPLYHDIVPPGEPGLGFIGIPFLIIPFPIFEIQAKWFVKQLVGEFDLPDTEGMRSAVSARSQAFEQAGGLKRHFHRLGDQQEVYFNTLASECGSDPLPGWFIQSWQEVGKAREKDPAGYKSASLPVRGPTVCRTE